MSSVSATGTRLRRRLSSTFQRDSEESGFFTETPSAPGTRGQQPVRDLPVAADPAMAPLHVRDVARRIAFVQFDIAEQAGAHVTAFQQIVTQDAVFRQAFLQREFERVDIVDAPCR